MIKTLERYVFGAFLSSFLLSFLVLSFVLTVGLMVQIVGYILQGLPAGLVGCFALVSFPETMQWTIPLGLLVASILVFSRLSADSEVAAMRACGVNLLTVMRWPIFFGIFCTLLCLFINNEVVPRGHQIRRDLQRRISVGAGLELLEPGRMIDDFPKATIYFEEKEGNWLHDLIVLDYSNPRINRMITASKALVRSEERDIVLDLHGMTVDPLDEDHPGMARAARLQYRVKDALKDSVYKRREKDFRFFEMMREIDQAYYDVKNPEQYAKRIAEKRRLAAEKAKKDNKEELTENPVTELSEEQALKVAKKSARKNWSNLRTEFQKRLVFAFASICFVLIGVPLGIRAQRKESTIGMAISLVTALCYYLVVILMMSLAKNDAVHPEMLIWLPVLVCLVLSSILVPKNL